MQLAPIVPGYPKYEIWIGATLKEKIESLVFLVKPLRSTAISIPSFLARYTASSSDKFEILVNLSTLFFNSFVKISC